MKVIFGNGVKDVPLSDVTKENYIVPKGEESLYHVVQELRQFDQKTGKRLSRPVLQKYDVKVWDNQRKALTSWGYDLNVVHDPADYLRKQQEERERTQAERQRQAQEAEARRKAAEREALKAELKAELMAEMQDAGTEAKPKAQGNKKSNTKK